MGEILFKIMLWGSRLFFNKNFSGFSAFHSLSLSLPETAIFFCEVDPNWDHRTQAHWPIALYLSFKFIGCYLGVQLPYKGHNSAQPRLFYLFRIHPGKKLSVCILTFFNTGHSHRMRTNVSFSAPHLLHEGVFALLLLCSMYCRLICPVRCPTNILQCFLSSLLMNLTYLSVGPSRPS